MLRRTPAGCCSVTTSRFDVIYESDGQVVGATDMDVACASWTSLVRRGRRLCVAAVAASTRLCASS